MIARASEKSAAQWETHTMQRKPISDPHDPPDSIASHAELWRRLEGAVLRSPGTLDAGVRDSLAAGREIPEVPEPLAVYVEKVARHAYRVTDDDVRALLAAGYSQDQVFEATLSVAFGAAQRRLRAGLEALRAASQESETSKTSEAPVGGEGAMGEGAVGQGKGEEG